MHYIQIQINNSQTNNADSSFVNAKPKLRDLKCNATFRSVHTAYRFRLITTRLAMQIRLLSMQNCVPYVSSTRTQGGEDTEKRGGKFSNLWIQMKMKEIIKTFKF